MIVETSAVPNSTAVFQIHDHCIAGQPDQLCEYMVYMAFPHCGGDAALLTVMNSLCAAQAYVRWLVSTSPTKTTCLPASNS